MTTFERITQAVLIVYVIVVAWFLLAMFVNLSARAVDTANPPQPASDTSLRYHHLPTVCAPFYNDGTDRWRECMGVGKK